jgi:hypothetical protein
MPARMSDMLSFLVTLLLVGANAHAAEPAAGEERWLDIGGCRFLNPHPTDLPPQTSTNWTGQCHQGLVNGEGELSFQLPGKPQPIKYVGRFSNGRIEHGRWESAGFL